MKKSTFYTMITIISFITIGIDQFTKFIVNLTVSFGYSKEIIPNFFRITNARNFGAAWSILWDKRLYIILISCVALTFVLFLTIWEKDKNKYKTIYYGLLIGGIIGNLIDRIFLGYVIDFLDFKFFGYNYPIFNVSDIAIVLSVILICAECFLLKTNNEEELEVLEFDE